MKYDAKCSSCNSTFEYERHIKESPTPPPSCPKCSSEKTEKLFSLSPGSFILKGTGWYKKGGY